MTEVYAIHAEGGHAAQAVPVAEPEWSAAYKGLCLYMARVLQPAWEEEIMVPISPGSQTLQPNIPHHMLMVCPSPAALTSMAFCLCADLRSDAPAQR